MKDKEKIKKDLEIPLDLLTGDDNEIFTTNLSTIGLYVIETQPNFLEDFLKWSKEGLANGKLKTKNGKLTH